MVDGGKLRKNNNNNNNNNAYIYAHTSSVEVYLYLMHASTGGVSQVCVCVLWVFIDLGFYESTRG